MMALSCSTIINSRMTRVIKWKTVLVLGLALSVGCCVIWTLDFRQPHCITASFITPQQFLYSADDNRAECSEQFSDPLNENLYRLFLGKLLVLPVEPAIIPKTTLCQDLQEPQGLCHDLTCPVKFPSCPEKRLHQVLATRSPTNQPYLAAMDRSAAAVQPHRVIFASAASANHYGELQALIHNASCHVFPKLTNFTFVLYDMGLTPEQRTKTEQLCACTILDFPFSSLPEFFTKLTCYTWKPLIINTLLRKSEFTIWMDTSVRWYPNAPLGEVFQQLRERGVLLGMSPDGAIALRTRDSTFKFYGDRACQYHPFPEMYATYGLFHNEKFIREAVMEPWVSCAFSRECMCLPDHETWLTCRHGMPRREGACHRFDQSSLSIILTRLFLERSELLRIPEGVIKIHWNNEMNWFDEEPLSVVC